MPNLDSKNRVIIPLSLRKDFSWDKTTELAVCYDFTEKMLYIVSKENSSNSYIVDFRKMDSQGRFLFVSDCMKLLPAQKYDFVALLKKGKKLYVKGMGKIEI